MVIGFAAEPGRPALDGAGDNSPYAAALLRHVSAMAGTEFGTVMRMVAEEVYLKTDGRQLPWTNASLRRLLYFGEAPAPVEGPPGEILAERRRLLLTIADLPAVRRTQAENLARGGEVPMSVVFAMMQALGVDATGDPAAVEARLRAEIERFAENRRANAALANPDPEIERLSRLADEVEILYFGLMPEFQGRGLARFFLSGAIDAAWANDPKKVTIHTNTLDSPRALQLYQKLGFVPVSWSEEVVEPWL
jgi:uncharacterized caspase-like protein